MWIEWVSHFLVVTGSGFQQKCYLKEQSRSTNLGNLQWLSSHHTNMVIETKAQCYFCFVCISQLGLKRISLSLRVWVRFVDCSQLKSHHRWCLYSYLDRHMISVTLRHIGVAVSIGSNCYIFETWTLAPTRRSTSGRKVTTQQRWMSVAPNRNYSNVLL